MSISNYIAGSIGLVAACAPSFAADSPQEALVIYARPHVVSAQQLASDIRQTGRTSCYLGFVPGSARLDVASYAQVQELAAMLRDDAMLKVSVTITSGGTFDNGTIDSDIARERALTLIATLRNLDVMPSRVVAAPLTNPVAVAFNDLAQRATAIN